MYVATTIEMTTTNDIIISIVVVISIAVVCGNQKISIVSAILIVFATWHYIHVIISILYFLLLKIQNNFYWSQDTISKRRSHERVMFSYKIAKGCPKGLGNCFGLSIGSSALYSYTVHLGSRIRLSLYTVFYTIVWQIKCKAQNCI